MSESCSCRELYPVTHFWQAMNQLLKPKYVDRGGKELIPPLGSPELALALARDAGDGHTLR